MFWLGVNELFVLKLLGCQEGAVVFTLVGVKEGAALLNCVPEDGWAFALKLPGCQDFLTLNAGASVFMLKLVRIVESGRQIFAFLNTYVSDFWLLSLFCIAIFSSLN